jgi:hypothetical protein
MAAWLLKLLDWFVGLLINRQPAPSPEPTLSQVQDAVYQVQKQASDAGDTVARATDTADKLRAYEASDPNNRDNG